MRNPVLLQICQDIQRTLSTPEYYHACIGTSPHTIEPAREIVYVLEGEGTLPLARWQQALDAVIAVNPGTRLRVQGRCLNAQWRSDGVAMPLRAVDAGGWDGQSETGAGFLRTQPLDLTHGPLGELIIAERNDRTRVIARVLHAAMDGRGLIHFYHELFRALRGEPLLGTNAAFSDVDLMRHVGARETTSKHQPTVALTGEPRGADTGNSWQRLTIHGVVKNVMPRIAVAIAEHVATHSELPALIGVPVDLRRHAPGLHSTMNYSSMLLVPLRSGEGPEVFRDRLRAMLDARMETVYHPVFDAVRLLPLPWFDRLVSRTPRNYRTRKPLETVVISNLGHHAPEDFSCDGFAAQNLFVLPLPGATSLALFGMGDQLEITLGMPKLQATDQRLTGFLAKLQQVLV